MKLALRALDQNLESTDSILYATISTHEIDLAEIKSKQESTLSLLGENSELLYSLIRKSRNGDTQAMGALYEHFKTPLFGLAIRYTYDFTAAEDLIQEIFIKVFTHIQDLTNDEAFIGWMYRIAVNTCLSYVRSKKRHLSKTVSLTDVEGTSQEKGEVPVDQTLSKPLEEAIQNLPARLKSVFLLHDVQGFKHEEVAEILSCSVGTSKSQLFKARMKIRKHLKDKNSL
jgi:RNA polymerase sigma-70 factor (ECF subfamily)